MRMEGPADLTAVCVALASHMVRLCTGKPYEKCETDVRRVLGNGQALQKLREMVVAQGGDSACIDHPERLPRSAYAAQLIAPKEGFITAMDSHGIGTASCLLGAGRTAVQESIAPGAGILFSKRLGDRVKQGEPIATLYFDEEARLEPGRERLLSAISIGDTPPASQPLIYSVLGDGQT